MPAGGLLSLTVMPNEDVALCTPSLAVTVAVEGWCAVTFGVVHAKFARPVGRAAKV